MIMGEPSLTVIGLLIGLLSLLLEITGEPPLTVMLPKSRFCVIFGDALLTIMGKSPPLYAFSIMLPLPVCSFQALKTG